MLGNPLRFNWTAEQCHDSTQAEALLTAYEFEPSSYTLAVTRIDQESGKQAGREIPLGELEITPLPRVSDSPVPAHPTSARWSNRIAVPGYDLTTSTDTLRLKLYWLALRRMDDSYKMFVHSIDRSTVTIVAQEDTVPHQWTCPTSRWERGEAVADTVTLPFCQVGRRPPPSPG